MTGTGWALVAIAAIQGAWLTFDGAHAIVLGDYVTPRSGPGAGKLGPWSSVVSAAGLEPRSGLVKGIHVVLGIAWLASGVLFALGVPGATWALLACGVASLWYLPIGTVLGAAAIVLVILRKGN